MNNKKVILITTIIIILIIITIFVIFNYKNQKNGNTMTNKSEEEILQYILNISKYRATLDIEIQTNKNTTKYIVEQEFQNNKSTQTVVEPDNISGVITQYDGTNLNIKNNKLDLETTFQNYSYIVDNRLWLDSFISDYKKYESRKITIKDEEIILEVKNEENSKYNVYKKLYIDKKTGKPTKMIVQDINQNTIVYILYTKIEIS